MERKFAALVLTHGRANNVMTVKTLRKHGYTGEIYIVIDDEDEQEEDYRRIYGDHVKQFRKEAQCRKVDRMNIDVMRKVILYARNAAFEIAEEIGLTHFVELDDDYKSFEWRWGQDGKLKVAKIKNLDAVFACMLDFLDATNALTVALAQGGDFVGGSNGGIAKNKISRKAMNSFFCRVDRPFQFVGAINEDVNTYVSRGNRGDLFFTVGQASLTQAQTQKQSGGMTAEYLDKGTYVKSFHTVMIAPSCVKISEMGNKQKRIHHNVLWRYAVPKILNEKWKSEVIAFGDGQTTQGDK